MIKKNPNLKKGGRPKAVTPDNLSDPEFLQSILAESLRNARNDRNRAVKFLTKVIQQEVDEGSDTALNFKANSVSKMFDSLTRVNTQIIEVAQMLIKMKEANAPKFVGTVPLQEVVGVDPDDLYDQFDDDEDELPQITKGN